jgi:F0F1-type ATP synthase assembly protein I
MSDEDQLPQDALLSAPQSAKSMQATEVVASALAVLWVGAVVGYVFTAPADASALGMVLTLLVVFLPLALIWAAITTLRSVRVLRHESQRLQATVEAMRAAYVLGMQQGPGTQPSVERKLDALAKQTETALASFSSRRDAGLTLPSANRRAVQLPPEAQGDAEQPALALGTPADVLQPRLGVADFTRALQFPESPDDKEGFRALRLALEDRNVAKLIRASQDVLTLLSQEGIYMDDLKPDRSRPELWRKFAGGDRGRAIAGLGGVRDRSSLALTSGRMREDPVFRDAAHHFLRTFDRCFAEFEPLASDADLADLADTRTARAFMLLGRVTGTFD